MSRNYKTGLIITGDASGGIRAIKATDTELGKLNKGFDKGSRQSKKFGSDAERAGRQLTEIDRGAGVATRGIETLRRAAAPIAGVIAGMFAANTIQNQIDWGDQLQKTNLRIGASTEALSQYNYVAKLSGVEFGQLTTAWQRQTRRIAEAAAGTGVASKALDRLGLSAKDLNQLAPEEQFERIATAMQNVESSSERVALAQKLWDSEGVKLVQIVNQGTDAIAAMRAEADALGLTISLDTANAMATYNDEVDRLKFAAQGLSQTLAAELVPSMTVGLQATSAFIQEIGGAETILNTTKDAAMLLAAIMAGRYAAAFASAAKGIATNTAATIAQAQADVAATSAARAKTAEALRVAVSEKAAAARAYENSRAIAAASGNTALRTKAITQMAAANQRAIAAEAAHTAAVNANTTAMARGTVAAQAMAGATRASAGALALVGGPGGAAVVAVGALYYFREELGFVDAAAQNATNALDANSDAIRDGTAAALDATYDNLVNSLEAVSLQAQEAMAQLTELEARQAFYENSHKGMADSVAGAVGDQAQALAGLWERQVELQTAIRENRAAREEATSADREGARALEDIVVTADAASKSTAKAAEETATLANSYENLLDRIQPNRRAARQYAQDVGVLSLALATGRMNTVQYMQAMGLLQESFQAAQRETDKTAQASEDASQRIANSFTTWGTVADNTLRSVDDAGRDAWLGLVDGSTSALDTVERAFEQTFANIAHMLTTQKLTFEVAGMMGLDTTGMQGGGSGMSLQNINPGMLKSGWDTASGWFSGGSSAGGLYSNVGAAQAGTLYGSASTGAAQGGLYGNAATGGLASTSYGAPSWAGGGTASGLAGGLYTAGAGFAGGWAGNQVFGGGGDSDTGAAIGTAAGAAIGSVIPVIGTYFGAAIGSFLGSGIGSMFGNETEFKGRFGTTATNDPSQYASSGKDGVFEHQDDGENFYGQSALGYTGFLDRGTKRLQRAGMGEDKGWAEELTAASVQMDNLVASIASSPEELEAMRSAVQGLETSSSNAGQIIEFALNERPRAALEALGGHFGEFVRGLEGGVESVVQQAQVAQQAHTLLSSGMERLNLQFDATAAGAYESASNIAEHAGGVDNLAALQNQYFDGFFTQAERAAFLQEDLTESLAAMGLELPENEAGFRALVEAQNQNTEAGGRNYVQLLQLSSGFSQLQSMLGDTSTAADAASESVDNTADSLRQIEAIERERAGINGKLLSALGDSAEMRRLELEAIDPSNRGLQEFVWGIEAFNDQIQAAEQRLSSARNTAASAWQSFDNQAYQQQLTLLEMLNDEEGALALQRERELQSIDPLLHESQRHIWAMQDQARAQEDATQAARGYINEMSRAQEQYSRTVLGINEWLDKENATGGTPGMNFAETQDQLARQLVLAQSGDRDALASITQYADRVLAANEEYNASSAAGQLVKDEVLAALEALPGQISAEEYLAEEIRTALFDALEGKATDSEINALMARVMAGDLSIEAALESIYGASDGTKDNTKTLEERSRDQLQELGWLVDEMSRTTGQFVSLNGTMSSLTSAIAALSSAQNDAAEVKQQRNAYEEAMQKASQYDDAAEGFRNKARATSQNVSDGRITAIRTEIDKYFDDDGEFGANDWNDTLSRLAVEFGRGSAEDVFGQAYASIYRNRTFADRQREKAASISNPQAGGGSAGGGGMDDLARADAYIRRYTDIQDAWNEERAAWQQRSGAKNIQEFGLWHAKNLGIAAGRQFAMGGMFAGGDELGRPAANSIVSRSTFFNIGEMGEEDPEAIMPLSRGAGGRLGIDASGLMRLPDGPLQLPMPEMPPLPQFPQLGGADVLQVLQDVKKELVETRKENKRLLELIGENTGDTVEAIEEAAARSEQQLDEQLDELETISRHSKTEIRTT